MKIKLTKWYIGLFLNLLSFSSPVWMPFLYLLSLIKFGLERDSIFALLVWAMPFIAPLPIMMNKKIRLITRIILFPFCVCWE